MKWFESKLQRFKSGRHSDEVEVNDWGGYVFLDSAIIAALAISAQDAAKHSPKRALVAQIGVLDPNSRLIAAASALCLSPCPIEDTNTPSTSSGVSPAPAIHSRNIRSS